MQIQIEKIKIKISKNKLKEVFENLDNLLKTKYIELHNQLIVSSAQYEEAKKRKRRGIQTNENYNLALNRIRYGLLDILIELQKKIQLGISISQLRCTSRCCKLHDSPLTRINIKTIHSENSSWIAKGIGVLGKKYRSSCAICSFYAEAVVKLVPIHCNYYKCPKCKSNDFWEYNILRIDTRGLEFDFEVKLDCMECQEKTRMNVSIQNGEGIKKIEINKNEIALKTFKK